MFLNRVPMQWFIKLLVGTATEYYPHFGNGIGKAGLRMPPMPDVNRAQSAAYGPRKYWN